MQAPKPSVEQQQATLEVIQQKIDTDLRTIGFETLLRRHKLDVSLGKIVVGRSFEFASKLADQARRYDPLVEPLATYHQVGLYQPKALVGSIFYTKYTMHNISRALLSEQHEPVELGLESSDEQLAVVHGAVEDLLSMQTA